MSKPTRRNKSERAGDRRLFVLSGKLTAEISPLRTLLRLHPTPRQRRIPAGRVKAD